MTGAASFAWKFMTDSRRSKIRRMISAGPEHPTRGIESDMGGGNAREREREGVKISPGDCSECAAMNNKMRFEFVRSMGFCASLYASNLCSIKETRI